MSIASPRFWRSERGMIDLQTTLIDAGFGALAIIDLALKEDAGTGDITTLATVPASRRASAVMLAKEPATIFGLEVAAAVFHRVDPDTQFEPLVDDGTRVGPGTNIAKVAGRARSVLLAERVALNFIQRLSGVATVTSRYVDAVQGTRARVVDTRKTTPGMRVLEKSAVRAGGGHNHRFGLSDGILIKDNHLAAVGGPRRITAAIRRAREHAPHTLAIEVETTNLDEVAEALAAGAHLIMLDNMSLDDMREAVQLVDGQALLEASGGITLETIGAVAKTGVDLISVGALTHSASAIDISLDFDLGAVS
jgi:nicotinate-nucleotide pyrophosphorylase (carboxylating)